MSDRGPIDMDVITELMRTPIIIRIVTILDITNLSILELLEYDDSQGHQLFYGKWRHTLRQTNKATNF